MLSVLLCAATLSQSYEPGANFRLYVVSGPVRELAPLVPGQTPNVDRRVERLDFASGKMPGTEPSPAYPRGIQDSYVVEVSGELLITQPGLHRFRLSSDDGSEMAVGGKTLVRNDGIHAMKSAEGQATLQAGWVPFVVRYFENDGQEGLKVEWQSPESDGFEVLEGSVLRVPLGITRVVSPGVKRLIIAGGDARPGKGLPLAGLHPGLDLFTCRPVGFEPKVGAMAFLPEGGLLVSTFLPHNDGVFDPAVRDGKVYLLTGVEGSDRSRIKVSVFADDLKDPLGLAVVPNPARRSGRSVYVSTQFEILELLDENKDGVSESRAVVANGWTSDNYHHFTFGLLEREGWLYASLSTSIAGGRGANGPNPPNRGTVFRVRPDRYDPANPQANIQFLSGGHRTPNGLFWGPDNQLFVGENQGAWQPANRINEVRVGAFFGHYNDRVFKTPKHPNGGEPSLFEDQPLEAPTLYVPQNEAGNSPAGAANIRRGPFAGQSLLTDVKYGGLHRVWYEKVDGKWQGGMVHFTQGLESGMNRIVEGPDGAFYLGGIGATDTWAWVDPKTGKWTQFGLQRIRFNGKSVLEIHHSKSTSDGFRLVFNQPVPAVAGEVGRYAAKMWTYAATPDYGGSKEGEEKLKVTRAVLSRDRRSVDLTIPGLKEQRVVHLVADIPGLWSGECWHTLNAIPGRTDSKLKALVFSRTEGFRHDSIPEGIAMIKSIAQERGWEVEATEDAAALTEDKLKTVDVVVFLNTTGDVLDRPQEEAFERFVRRGGGFVGVHSAADTEYNWPFYMQAVGAAFKSHPAIQPADVRIEDRSHPATNFLPDVWRRTDEWYCFRANPRANVNVLASLITSSYKGSTMGSDHPIMWSHESLGGRCFYTGMGHTKATYQEPKFRRMIQEAVIWTSRKRG